MTTIRRPNSRRQSSPTLLERRVIQSAIWILTIFLIATTSMVLYFMPSPKGLIDNTYVHATGSSTNESSNIDHAYDHYNEEEEEERYYNKLNHHRRQKEDMITAMDDDDDYTHRFKLRNDKDDDEQTKFQESKLFPFHQNMDQSTKQHLYDYANSIRNPFYQSNQDVLDDIPYDIYNCPDHPPYNYPYEYPLLDILNNWNPNDTTFESLDKRPKIYAAICRFNYAKDGDIQKALTYRQAEVPFILRDDPTVLQVVQRWNTPKYLSDLLNQGDKKKKYKNELSQSNHLMFFRENGKARTLKNWKPPMSEEYLTYDEFVEKASQPIEKMGPDKPHWYFRVNAKAPRNAAKMYAGAGAGDVVDMIDKRMKMKKEGHFLFQELPFFRSIENFYIVDPNETRGINCRFGMNGNIAEAHFDGSRNFVMIFGGERRYVLSHPKHCPNLALYPQGHPSGRHSELDWSNPDLESHPEFKYAKANEVVLQAGDALYLPTQWFHFIISLNLNWQCNARSGVTDHYKQHIRDCGF